MTDPTARRSTVEVIEAGISLLDEIVPLFDAYRRFYGQASDVPVARTFLEERIRRRESVVFVARPRDGAAIGFTQMYPSFSSVSMQRLWILNDLFVAAAARRQGVASALLERVQRYARDGGAKGLILETAADNAGAQALYESLGWRRVTDSYAYSYTL